MRNDAPSTLARKRIMNLTGTAHARHTPSMQGSRDYRLPPNAARALRAQIKSEGVRATCRAYSVHADTLGKAAAGKPLTAPTFERFRSLTPRVRTRADFGVPTAVVPPPARGTSLSWSVERIRSARDAQLRGQFAQPVEMARSMRTYGPIMQARNARLTPLIVVGTELKPHASARGQQLYRKALTSCTVRPAVRAGIHGTLVDHGIAIGYLKRSTPAAGTSVDFELVEWPLECVEYVEHEDRLYTTIEGGPRIPITHGDGTWVIFRAYDDRPWTQNAAVSAACIPWAMGVEGSANWGAAVRTHGLAKLLGSLPEGTPMLTSDDELSPEAAAFLTLLRDVMSGDAVAGIIPSGAKADMVSNSSTAAAVFDTYVARAERTIARIYTGSDAILGSSSDSPGVDVSALFDVATALTQSDALAISSALETGFYAPWAALNAGTSAYAPKLIYLLPDPDADQKRGQTRTNYERLTATLGSLRDVKVEVSQALVERLCQEFGVGALSLATSPIVSQLTLAPTDAALVVRGAEARAAQGLPPFGDPRDAMTIPEIKADAEAKAAVANAPPAPPAPPAPKATP